MQYKPKWSFLNMSVLPASPRHGHSDLCTSVPVLWSDDLPNRRTCCYLGCSYPLCLVHLCTGLQSRCSLTWFCMFETVFMLLSSLPACKLTIDQFTGFSQFSSMSVLGRGLTGFVIRHFKVLTARAPQSPPE
jgi:hypothetical protein